MDIVFHTPREAQNYNDFKYLVRAYGSEKARRIRMRFDQLKAASNLAEFRNLPGPRCHELTGDRKGQLAVDVKHPFRLILEPANDPLPQKADGGLDWTAVTAVKIIEVTDYHGK